MSGSFIGGVIGAVIGYVVSFGSPTGALYGYTIGAGIGSILMPPEGPDQRGPRLDDLRVQSSEYGRPIPIVYGTVGIQGNVIWASDLIEVETEEDQDGKGGGGSSVTKYTYFGNMAVAVCDGPVKGIMRIWAGPDKRLIYDGFMLESGTMRIYLGDDSQMPDPLIEQYEGVGNVPAYRGTCYVVIENFALKNDGNTLPFLTFEVGGTSAPHGKEPVLITDEVFPVPLFDPLSAVVDPKTGWIWVVEHVFLDSTFRVLVINDATQEIVTEFALTPPWGIVTTMNVTAEAGLVWILTVPWVLTQRRAGVAVFTSGEANQDGSIKELPQFSMWAKLGKDGPPLGAPWAVEKPMDPGVIFSTQTDVWVAYAFTNVSYLHIAYFPIGQMSFGFDPAESYTQNKFGEYFFDFTIGSPYHMAGDMDYIGIAGALGPGGTNPNFVVIDARTGLLLHAVRWEIGGIQVKTFDYDPVRKKFFSAIGGFGSQSITVLDAVTGEIETVLLASSPGDTDPPPTVYPTAVTYSKRTDRYLVGGSGDSIRGSTVWVVDPNTLATQAAVTFELGGTITTPMLDPALNNRDAPYVIAFDAQLDRVVRLYIEGKATAAPANLGDIVMDLHRRSGLPEAAADVSELVDDVPGYAIARQTQVRAAIDALRPLYYFDAVESNRVIRYPKRGKAAVVDIPDEDLAAHEPGAESGDPLSVVRKQDVDLPRVINVRYMSAATKYEQATKTAKRLIGRSLDEATMDVALSLSDTKAQEIAEVNLHGPWVERITYGFNLPRKYSYLEPTDLITIQGSLIRLTSVTSTPKGILKCEGVRDDSAYYTPHVVVTETPPVVNTPITLPGETFLELM
jgi:hypothetical protein